LDIVLFPLFNQFKTTAVSSQQMCCSTKYLVLHFSGEY